jgi:pyruvate dehydrogenase E1 component alpha subunit
MADTATRSDETAPPDPETAREWLRAMLLIRRFEERAGEMYAKAKIGGFLHLAIGEEATIVGTERAMRDEDYLIATYRSHGHTLARGTEPERVMAELFGREDGVCRGRGGSMHMFDLERRFMGGYGIVGGNLPIGAGFALRAKLLDAGDVTVCTFGDGASNQGTFGETMNLAALWKLPIVFQVTNNQFGMGTALSRHSAVTDLMVKGESFGVPGMRCDGMDVVDTHRVMCEAIEQAREKCQPVLVEAVTYRFRGHSMADPEEYRSKEEVKKWRERDPITTFAERAELDPEEFDEEVVKAIDEAVAFADRSAFPVPESLYDDIYVMGDQVKGWYSVDERSAGVHKGEDERNMAEDDRGPEQEYHRTVERTEPEEDPGAQGEDKPEGTT